MSQLTSRERLLRAITRQDVDYLPCSFMSFAVLRRRLNEDRCAVAIAEQEMGLDPFLFLPTASRLQRADHPDLRGLPLNIHPAVTTREWSEPGGEFGLLHKEYTTPAGRLSTSVRLSEDWPHGAHIPFMDDYQVPRHIKPLITEEADLEALQYFLLPPSEEQAAAFREEAETARAFTQQRGILLAGGWGVGMDMLNWLCGMENLILLVMDRPAMVDRMLEMIHAWNLRRMALVLSAPVDLYLRRAWYEGCDFVPPRFYRKSILPRLKAEADLAHQHGAKFGYICSSGTRPMLDLYREAGVDVLIGVDPVQGTHTDLPLMKEKLAGSTALWGGVSGAITVEQGSADEVRAAVQSAVQALGPRGFILSPVDNLTVDTPRTWENVAVFVDEWKRVRSVG
jgi:uroporphyrinogen-III decarboxylase